MLLKDSWVRMLCHPQTIVPIFMALIAGASASAYDNTNPALSPDGQYLAFYSDRTGNEEIFVIDMASGVLRQVTDDPQQDYGPAWAPDGRTLYFYRGGDGQFEAQRTSIGSADPRVEQVTDLGGYVSNPVVSPDGGSLLFSWNGNGNYDIYALDMKSGEMRQITRTPYREYVPVWSPDGARIAFSSPGGEGDNWNIYVMNADGSDVRLVADAEQNDYYPEWSPDGQFISFFSGPDYHHFDLYIVDLNSGAIEQITQGMGSGKATWCADMTCIIFGADHPDGSRLFIAKPDGSRIRLVDGQ